MIGGAWTCVGTSAAVAPGGRIRVFVDGEEYVLWRGASGVARMFHNRCPHRGMRLSFGFVRGETLTCPYHGWRYGADGRCVGIPAHPDLEPPATIRAPVLRVIEAAGLLFAAPAESADTAPPVPDGPYRPCRSIFVDAGLGVLQAALRSDLPAGWSISLGPPWVIEGTADSARFSALAVFQQPQPGVAAAHASVATTDATAALAVAHWLVASRSVVEGLR